MKKESNFQHSLIKRIKQAFPGSMVFKMDPTYIQGMPDLFVVYNDKWAALECKRDSTSSIRPNQEYYIMKMNDMSFARFIDPINEDLIFEQLGKHFALK